MEHPIQAPRATIAWFKLAEFVTRKEKERALVALKLLSHSISDRACSALLEADLLSAFKDERAVGVYERSAHLYLERNNVAQAAFIYEHLAQITGDIVYIQQAMQLCCKEGLIESWSRCAVHIGRLLIESGKYDQIDSLCAQLPPDASWRAWVLGELIMVAVRQEPLPESLLQDLAQGLIATSLSGPAGNTYITHTIARVAIAQPAAATWLSGVCGVPTTAHTAAPDAQ